MIRCLSLQINGKLSVDIESFKGLRLCNKFKRVGKKVLFISSISSVLKHMAESMMTLLRT